MVAEEVIERLRSLSREIDRTHLIDDIDAMTVLLGQAMREAEAVDEAYALFFKGEQAAYVADENAQRVALFRQAVALRSGDWFLLRNYGVSLSIFGDRAEAIEQFNKALSLNPKDARTWGCKGVALNDQGKFGDAIEHFETGLALDPKDYHAWREKGVVLSNIGKVTEALECTEKALSFNPGDVIALANKSYCLYKLGRIEAALSLINSTTTDHPRHGYVKQMHQHLLFLTSKGPAPAARDGKPEMQRLSLQKLVGLIREEFKDDSDKIIKDIDQAKNDLNDFLKSESRFHQDSAQFLVLRKWNSYTPCIPRSGDERSVGGGYYFLVNGVGTVVDPGFNFLENFHRIGGRIADISNIVITHAHNDHTADLESILSLIFKYNDDKNYSSPESDGFKTINLFMNVGSDRKFSGFIDLRGAEHINVLTVLTPNHEYDMGQNLILRVLPAYHDEVVGKKYAVGLQFELRENSEDPTRVIITSDTGLFPKKGKTADTSASEIWELYDLDDKAIHLLIPHLGSVKASEFDANIESKPDEVYYPNHLGLIGTIRVISALEPDLAVVSEFGEELREFQGPLVAMIASCVHKYPTKKAQPPVVLPGDITFMYDLRQRGVYCIACQMPVQPSKDLVARKDEKLFHYVDKTKVGRMTEETMLVERFEGAIARRELSFLHRKPTL